MISKQAARDAFSKAARNYDASAVLQREIGGRMLERLDYIGGTLEMESQPGRGSQFLLLAPLTTEASSTKEPHDGSENSTR